jgi:hypothetical protein
VVVVGPGLSEVVVEVDVVEPAVGFPDSWGEHPAKPTHSATSDRMYGVDELLVN